MYTNSKPKYATSKCGRNIADEVPPPTPSKLPLLRTWWRSSIASSIGFLFIAADNTQRF
jgi:hypothetical protein